MNKASAVSDCLMNELSNCDWMKPPTVARIDWLTVCFWQASALCRAAASRAV